MTKNNNYKFLDFLRSEISFWLAIIGIIVSVTIAFGKLDSRISASEAKVSSNEILLQEIDKKVDSLLINQAEIQKDIEYIKKNIK